MQPETRNNPAVIGRLPIEIPVGSQILIVCDDAGADALIEAIRATGVAATEKVQSITAACDKIKSGRFQLVLSKPLFNDGSWRRLVDVARHYDLGCEVILLARNFEDSQAWDAPAWADTQREQAEPFDVLDVTQEATKTASIVKQALWAAYLKGAGPKSVAHASVRAA